MVVCRLHDTAGSLAHVVFISRPTGNPDPLAKSRPTCKIQTHWLGHKVVHIVTLIFKNWSLVFINILFIYIHLIKPWHKKKTVWLTGAWGRTLRCDPSRITLNLLSRVIRLGSQLEESFLTHLSTIRFSLITHMPSLVKAPGPLLYIESHWYQIQSDFL